MGVARLDDRIQSAQIVTVGAGDPRRVEHVQNRLVVLVDQHHDALPRLVVEGFEQSGEASGRGAVLASHARAPFDARELLHDVGLQGGPAR